MQPDDTPDFDPEWVAHHLADLDNADIRDKAAEVVRLHGTVEVDGKFYRYDSATGGIVEATPKAEPPGFAPPDDDDTADFVAPSP